MGDSKGSSKREVYSHEHMYKRTKRSQINDIMLHLKLLEKQEQANPKTSRREIIKTRAEFNELETKKKNTKNQQNKKLVF
jgi:hypothetical protein